MGLKPDHWIRKMALEHGMIEPFIDRQVREGVISYGRFQGRGLYHPAEFLCPGKNS